jgi:hypothetical protein
MEREGISLFMEGLHSLRPDKAGKNFSVNAENVSVYGGVMEELKQD